MRQAAQTRHLAFRPIRSCSIGIATRDASVRMNVAGIHTILPTTRGSQSSSWPYASACPVPTNSPLYEAPPAPILRIIGSSDSGGARP